jgi:hypothetical protein
MTPEQIFSAANSVALAGWLILVFAPHARWARTVVAGILPAVLLAALYALLLMLHWGGGEGNFSSLAGVHKLFSNPWVLLAGWIHYLAFDLFVGAWEVRDGLRHAIPRWMLVPCLVLTFLLGPTGFLLYVIIRRGKTGSWTGGG